MELQRKLLLVVLILVVITTPACGQGKPGCQDSCGNVSIPYPFGTTPGCYLNPDFLIACNETFGLPLTFLWNSNTNINVTNISLKGELEVRNYVARECYDLTGKSVENWTTSFGVTPFKISPKNKFTAVGCNTIAQIEGYPGNESYASGCISTCDSVDYITNGSCSGIGCCQTSIPKAVDYFEVRLDRYYNNTNPWNFSPCSYAFVVEQDKFNFSANDFLDLRNVTNLPMIVDWAIGNQTCEVAKNSNGYACKGNSECYNVDNGPGYRCSCLEGYEGNPYLLNSCQDIDECNYPNLNKCEKICVNTPGNYACSCPEGYNGDGRKDGTGCSRSQSLIIKIFLGTAISVVVLVVVFSWIYLGFKKRRLIMLKEKFFMQNGGLMLQQKLSRHEGSNETAKIFSAEELERATHNYDESRIIGKGGFGTVYKGILADNKIVAIKKSKIVDQTQTEQFINEVVVLSQINHRNVVKLLGCCLETSVPLLVYEFINNGTLFDHIHNKTELPIICWEIRLRIAAETAGVLSYLHSAASTPIIHRDIKSTNILLDINYTAKVSDFGASRLVPLDHEELSTLVQGTLGYLDPEYLHTSQLTEKSDVYSFGVVLVELLTGKKALSFDRPEEERNLARYFVSSLKEDRLFQIVDDAIVHEGNINQLTEVAKLAKKCLRVKGEERPTMKEVAMELEGLRMMKNHPWTNLDLSSEETESLLGETSIHHGREGSINTTTKYDSISPRTQEVFSVYGGR